MILIRQMRLQLYLNLLNLQILIHRQVIPAEYLNALKAKITALTDVLGLITEKEAEMLDEEIENLIAQRQQARKDRDFAKADEIRDTLLAKGIVLEDTREGVRWKRA